MATIEWQEKFSVNVDDMDQHHRKFLGYLNKLQPALAADDPGKKLGEAIFALIEYARFHFSEEEKLLKEIQYPDLEAQISQHNFFNSEICIMCEQFNRGELPGQSVVAFIRDWFLNHIMQEDRNYGRFLAGREQVPQAM